MSQAVVKEKLTVAHTVATALCSHNRWNHKQVECTVLRQCQTLIKKGVKTDTSKVSSSEFSHKKKVQLRRSAYIGVDGLSQINFYSKGIGIGNIHLKNLIYRISALTVHSFENLCPCHLTHIATDLPINSIMNFQHAISVAQKNVQWIVTFFFLPTLLKSLLELCLFLPWSVLETYWKAIHSKYPSKFSSGNLPRLGHLFQSLLVQIPLSYQQISSHSPPCIVRYESSSLSEAYLI